MSIKCVFCDIGNVLVRSDVHEIYQKYQNEYQIASANLRSVFEFLHSGNTTEKQLSSFLRSKNIDENIWENFTNELYSSEKRNDSLYKLLENAKYNQKIKIIYTTNNVANTKKILDKYSILSLPDLIVSSADIGVAKPSSEYWLKAFDLSKSLFSDLTYDQILVIDDSQENIDSAQKFGFITVHYKGIESNEEIKTALYSNEETAKSEIKLSSEDEIKDYFYNLK